MVDPCGVDRSVGGEHFGFQGVDVAGEGVGDLDVAVDDHVRDRVEDGDACAAEVLGVVLELAA